MKKLIWFATGVGLGVYLAKQLDENPRAQAAVDVAAEKAKQFGAAVSEGFREREAELSMPATSKKAAPVERTSSAAKKPAARKSAVKTTPKK